MFSENLSLWSFNETMALLELVSLRAITYDVTSPILEQIVSLMFYCTVLLLNCHGYISEISHQKMKIML